MLLGLIIRIYNLDFESFWYDEIFTAKIINFSFSEIISITAIDVHPPLYYLLLKIWAGIFSDSDFAIRMFSVIISVFSISIIYLFSKKIFNQKLALLVTFLLAFSLLDVVYAKEARMYSLLSLLVTLEMFSVYFYLKTSKNKYLVVHILSATLCLYTQNLSLFYLFTAFIFGSFFAFKQEDKRIRNRFLGSYLLIILFYLPWIPSFLNQMKSVNSDFWIEKISVFAISETILEYSGNLYLGTLFLFIVAIGAIKISKKSKMDFTFLLFWMLLPLSIILFLSLSSLTTTIYKIRFFLPSLIPFLILLAAGLEYIYSRKKIIFYPLVALILIISIFENHERANSLFKERWRDVAEYIDKNIDKNDAVILMVRDEFNKVGGSKILIDRYFKGADRQIFTLEDSIYNKNFSHYKRILLIKSHGMQKDNRMDSILDQSHLAKDTPEFTGKYRRFSFLNNGNFIIEAKGISKSIFLNIFDSKENNFLKTK